MIYNSRVLAFLLALCISLLTTLFLVFFEKVDFALLTVTFAISFSVSYILAFALLELLIFREINKIYKMMGKLKKRKFQNLTRKKHRTLNSLEKINEEIFSFAELKQKEIDELRKLEAFRKEFIADISHELKTPIFAAQGFVHTLLDGAVNDETVRGKFLMKAARSLDALDALVQDLLTLSQIETRQIKMHFETVDLHKLTQEVFEQLEDKAQERKVTLILEGSKNKALVKADWQRITQVMTNLISNAIEHSPEGGEVTVFFDMGKKNVTTHVRDRGEGIAPEHLPRIFERFYRVDKSRSREKGGTGLGLAIVKHILGNHNSKAKVESMVGEGSVFSFKLERVKREPED